MGLIYQRLEDLNPGRLGGKREHNLFDMPSPFNEAT